MSRKRKPIPQEPIEVDITGLSHEGRGIARHQDKIHFIFGALKGEKVKAKTTHCSSRYHEATAIEIIAPSLQRTLAACSHFGVCGGCSLQHMLPQSQIEFKQSMLQELLQHQAKIEPQSWLPPLLGNFLGYRQKARLGVRYVEKKQALLVGFREQKNSKIALIDSCQVLDPRVGLQISALRSMINSLEAKETIPQIEVAIGGDEVALVFRHLKPLSENDRQSLIDFCSRAKFAMYLQPGGNDSVHKIWPIDSPLHLKYELHDQQLQYYFHPLDFTQVNQEINQKMINQALALLEPNSDDNILDLFCGLGNFSLPLAQKAKRVVGVEGSTEMVARAQINAKLNHITNTEYYACDLNGEFSALPWAKQHYSKIVLDPPRSGALEIVSQISIFKASAILYVSCNPTTFSRDAAILVHQHGYRLAKVGVMDMFPQTAHVEVMGLFQKD